MTVDPVSTILPAVSVPAPIDAESPVSPEVVPVLGLEEHADRNTITVIKKNLDRSSFMDSFSYLKNEVEKCFNI